MLGLSSRLLHSLRLSLRLNSKFHFFATSLGLGCDSRFALFAFGLGLGLTKSVRS